MRRVFPGLVLLLALVTGCEGGGSARVSSIATSTPTVLTSVMPLPATYWIKPPRRTPPPEPTFAFADGQHGWFASGETLLSTDDGGRTWLKRANLPLVVRTLSFISARDGWAATSSGLFATNDGGTTWKPAEIESDDEVAWVQFTDQLNGWIVTMSSPQDMASATVRGSLRTRDGGASWSAFADPCLQPSNNGADFAFATPEIGWAICNFPIGAGMSRNQLWTSEDGGLHWALLADARRSGDPTPSPGSFPALASAATDLFFFDAAHGWFTLAQGPLVATVDGAATWRKLPTTDTVGRTLVGVIFVSPVHGFVLSWPDEVAVARTGEIIPALFETRDGGQAWGLLCAGNFLRCGR